MYILSEMYNGREIKNQEKSDAFMRPPSGSSWTLKRRIILSMLAVTLVLLVIVGVTVVNGITTGKQVKVSPQATPTPSQNGSTSTPTVQTSPLLFGTNLGLFGATDQVVTSAATRALMQRIHVRIVRIPLRRDVPIALEVQAEQAVKSVGAIPLIILNGVRNPNALADDMRMIQETNSVEVGSRARDHAHKNILAYSGVLSA